MHNKKLSNLIPGYEVKTARFSHDPNKVIFNFSSHVLTEDKKVYFRKGLGFLCHQKKIDYTDCLTQFELLYRDTAMFEMRSENRYFRKNKLKDICFPILKSYNFDKVDKNLSKVESITLKSPIERKVLLFKTQTNATQQL